MTCREIAEFLMDYIDASLSPEHAKAFDAHLAVCRECRLYLDQYRRTVQLSRSAFQGPSTAEDSHPEVPPDLARAIARICSNQ